jgi:hypothetical protein
MDILPTVSGAKKQIGSGAVGILGQGRPFANHWRRLIYKPRTTRIYKLMKLSGLIRKRPTAGVVRKAKGAREAAKPRRKKGKKIML